MRPTLTLLDAGLEARVLDEAFALLLEPGVKVHEPEAAALLAERAALENRTGARALRDVFAEVVNPLEFDPDAEAKPSEAGRRKIAIDAARVHRARR